MKVKMKERTKEELSRLAEIMVTKYNFKDIKGTNEFVEYALFEAKQNDLDINWQTVKLRMDWLEMKCDYLVKESCGRKIEKPIWEDVDSDDMIVGRKITKVVVYYSDGTKESIPYQNETIPEKMIAKVPEYSMFVEGEDGLIILKGTYKGRLVHEIDELNFKGAAKGWSKWCLTNDKNLTDDDRTIFNKILLGQI